MPVKPKQRPKQEPFKLKLPASLLNELGNTNEQFIKHNRARTDLYQAPKNRSGSARQHVTKVQKRKNDRAQKRVQKDVTRVSSGQQYKQSQKTRNPKKAPTNPDTSVPRTDQVVSSSGKSRLKDNKKDEGESNSAQSDFVTGGTEIPKSILKRTKQPDKGVPAANKPTPPVTRSKISRAIEEKIDEDDAAIAALEKKLGIKGKKLPGYVKEDGLDDLLNGIDYFAGINQGSDDDMRGKKRKRIEDEKWLAHKRKKAEQIHETAESDENDMSGEDEFSQDDLVESEDLESDEESEEDGFEELDPDTSPPPEKRARENPYVAPPTGNDQPSTKYVPPSLRIPSASGAEDLTRLRRQLQGLVNRLTDSNLVSILGEVEKIYRANARQHVTSTLVDLLLTSVREPTSLPDTLIILPAGFIAAVYRIIGTDFGAHAVQRIVELFDEHYKSASELGNHCPDAATVEGSKETSNLITLLSELYNFQVVGSTLIFDYIRQFLGKLSEFNAELLLRVIRISGPQLRRDDPSSLKDIVIMLRPAIASVGEANLSVRTKFMIETINDLKNNKMKTGVVASAIVSQHHTRMKKTIGSLNTRNIKASEPLQISLKDIRDSDKKGKWWLVGASWAGSDSKTTNPEPLTTTSTAKSAIKITDIDNELATTDLLQLARDHRMNTDIRRSIFITILSASDYQDAHVRLLKLRLKRAQEVEIPRILLHCAAGEAAFNPYYMLIARQLCRRDRRLRKSFEFCCWDLFRRMGVVDAERGDDAPNDDDDDDDEGELDVRAVVNIARFYAHLVAAKAVSLRILKKLVPLSRLREKARVFTEIFCVTLFATVGSAAGAEAVLETIFGAVKGVEGLGVGLEWFLRTVVRKNRVVAEGEREVVGWGVGVARRVLRENEAG